MFLAGALMPFFEIFIYSVLWYILPGPINILSAAHGKKKGLVNSFGFVTGASLAFAFLAVTVVMVRDTAIEDFPQIIVLLKYVGSFYLLFISYCMVFLDDEALIIWFKGTFFDGILIQWVNPKSWICALFVSSRFSNIEESLMLYGVIQFVAELVCLSVWVYAGELISRKWSSPKQQDILDISLAISLAGVAIFLLIMNP